MDCLVGQDLFQFESHEYPNYENCKRLCTENNRCRAIAVNGDICFFKGAGCENDQHGSYGVTIFLPEGEFKEIKS